MIKKVKPHSEARPSWLNNNGTRQRSSLVWWVEFYCPAQSLGLVGGSSVVFEAHRAIRITTRYYHLNRLLRLPLLLINFQFINIEHVTNRRTLSALSGVSPHFLGFDKLTNTHFSLLNLGGGGKYLLQLFSFSSLFSFSFNAGTLSNFSSFFLLLLDCSSPFASSYWAIKLDFTSESCGRSFVRSWYFFWRRFPTYATPAPNSEHT